LRRATHSRERSHAISVESGQIEFVFRARRELGEVSRFRRIIDDELVVVTSNPDRVRSLFTADPELAPSLAGESPLRPIVGRELRAYAHRT
jgi:hypothetical protein